MCACRRGQPGYPPWRLALVTLMQVREGLSDRQAAEAVLPIAFLSKPFTAGQIKGALRRAQLVLGRDG